jgi:hypothetical protein
MFSLKSQKMLNDAAVHLDNARLILMEIEEDSAELLDAVCIIEEVGEQVGALLPNGVGYSA